MPPRSVTAAVVLFWLATTGWFLHREVRPLLIDAEPPRFAINLFDEAHEERNLWEVFKTEVTRDGRQEDKRIGKAETWVHYRKQEDQFELHSKHDLEHDLQLLKLLNLRVVIKAKSTYLVTRDGELRTLESQIKLSVPAHSATAEGYISGPVEDGAFRPEGWLALQGEKHVLRFDPVPLTGRGSVLNPMHPVHWVKGLRPGQEWRVPLFDPVAVLSGVRIEDQNDKNQLLAQVLKVLQLRGLSDISTVHAQVKPQPETLAWGNKEVPCLVIVYRSGNTGARTWVRASDGMVLQQQAEFQDERITLKRTTPHVP